MAQVIDIYKIGLHVFLMKLKDILSRVSKNKKNGQLTTCIKKNKLKETGMSPEELLNMNIEPKLKRLLLED